MKPIYYLCRQRGALGLCTDVISAINFDEFLAKTQGRLEPLAAYNDPQEARSYLTSEAMNPLRYK